MVTYTVYISINFDFISLDFIYFCFVLVSFRFIWVSSRFGLVLVGFVSFWHIRFFSLFSFIFHSFFSFILFIHRFFFVLHFTGTLLLYWYIKTSSLSASLLNILLNLNAKMKATQTVSDINSIEMCHTAVSFII